MPNPQPGRCFYNCFCHKSKFDHDDPALDAGDGERFAVDKKGIIRYSHIGEGAYDKTESTINN